MKVLVISFDDGVDLSAFLPETAVDISSPVAVSGAVVVNALAKDAPAIAGTYNITPV